MMTKERTEAIVCDSCSCEIATVYKKQDGLKELVVHHKVSIAVVDKDKNVGSITCPGCGIKMTTDLGFWRRF